MKAIIIYYSKSGNTEKLAERIGKDIGAEIIRITPEKEYGIYISAATRVAKKKRKNISIGFKNDIPILAQYNLVFIGYPVWYQDIPPFVADFISQCDLAGKIVIPFATFGATGVKWTLKTLEEKAKGAMIIYPFDYGILKKDDYEKWMENIRELKITPSNEK